MKSLDLLPQNWDEEIEGNSPDMGPEDMGPEEVRAANMLRALANPHRLKILRLLERAPHTVMDICERLKLRQSLASQHLARLRIRRHRDRGSSGPSRRILVAECESSRNSRRSGWRQDDLPQDRRAAKARERRKLNQWPQGFDFRIRLGFLRNPRTSILSMK